AVERGDAFARRPQLAMTARRVLERRLDRVAAPQPGVPVRSAPGPATTLHPPGSPAQVLLVLFRHGGTPLPAAPLTGKRRFAMSAPTRPDDPSRGHLSRARPLPALRWTGGRVVKGS